MGLLGVGILLSSTYMTDLLADKPPQNKIMGGGGEAPWYPPGTAPAQL